MAWAQVRSKVNSIFDNTFNSVIGSFSKFVFELGQLARFTFLALRVFVKRPMRWTDLIQQMEFVGNQSVFIIILTGAFTGMAVSFQIYLGFRLINAVNLVGPTVAMGIARELGPVLSGLIVAARAGGAMAANLGSMRVSEQIDAIEVMGVDPIRYLVSPRIMAAVITMPFLTGIFDFVAIGGSYFLCIYVLDLDPAIFWEKTTLWLNPNHINEGLIKAAVFGLIFGAICTYRGFYTKGGARDVGDATNRGVVLSMVMIIIVDFFMMNLIDFYYKLVGSGG
ncbi:MAG: ABC transporter permease [Bdellovibrionales bacterium]|nr:ABC transporter permease [Bdellovibrionales bacterium]